MKIVYCENIDMFFLGKYKESHDLNRAMKGIGPDATIILTDPKFIRAEPNDFSNMSDDEIISLHRIHESSVSGADLAISAYKFGGARHANRIMDIFYQMSKYPVYIDC